MKSCTILILLGLLNCNFAFAVRLNDKSKEKTSMYAKRKKAVPRREETFEEITKRLEALKLNEGFDDLRARLEASARFPDDIGLDLKKEAQNLQTDLLKTYRSATSQERLQDAFVGTDIHDSVVPLEQYFELHCFLKKEDPQQTPSQEKILKVSDRLKDFLQTMQSLDGTEQILDEQGWYDFRKGADYIDCFINGSLGKSPHRQKVIYLLDAFFDLVEEKTKEFALRNTISTVFQDFKLSARKGQNHTPETPAAYLIWSQLCLARRNNERFDPAAIIDIPGNDIGNAIDSLIQDIKEGTLHLEGLDKMQHLAAFKIFGQHQKNFNAPWTTDNYNKTFAEKVGTNLVVSKYWSKFLPHLVFYLHNLVNANGISMDANNFPGARCATGTKADLLISAGRMLRGKMDAHIDFGDCK